MVNWLFELIIKIYKDKTQWKQTRHKDITIVVTVNY